MPAVDTVIMGIGSPAAAAGWQPNRRHLALTVLLASPIFGAAMGSFDMAGERIWYAVFAAVKMPLMVFATTAVCLPGFIVLMTVLRLRDDLREAGRAIMCGQAAIALALASMAPMLLFLYASGIDHRWALLCSGLIFALATVVGQIVMLRWYRALLARNLRHRVMLAYWLIAYVFVGIQMGWMLRPFVGSPGIAPEFIRTDSMTNAYVAVGKLIIGQAR